MSKDDARRLGRFVEDYVNSLPFAKHVTQVDVLWHSPLLPPKGDIGWSEYDIYLYNHYNNDNGVRINLKLGLKLNDKRSYREH